jgi:hypothetical protein
MGDCDSGAAVPSSLILPNQASFLEIVLNQNGSLLGYPVLGTACGDVLCQSPSCSLCENNASDDITEGAIATAGGALLLFASFFFFILEIKKVQRKRQMKANKLPIAI